MPDIGIGLVGGGYMGKAHAVALSAVGPLFETALRPRLEVIAATTPASAARYAAAYGFARATDDWRDLVADPKVQAVVIAGSGPGELVTPKEGAVLSLLYLVKVKLCAGCSCSTN